MARDKVTGRIQAVHGLTNTPIFSVWTGIRTRCLNPNSKDFPAYGGRGITMCDRWRDSVVAFAADMGERPRGYVIDRIDPNGPYEKSNCRWISLAESNRNKRSIRVVTFRGRDLRLIDLAREVGIPRHLLYHRIYIQGWDVERAATEPIPVAAQVNIGGTMMTWSQAAHRFGFHVNLIRDRVEKLGWTLERAISTPPRKMKARRKPIQHEPSPQEKPQRS